MPHKRKKINNRSGKLKNGKIMDWAARIIHKTKGKKLIKLCTKSILMFFATLFFFIIAIAHKHFYYIFYASPFSFCSLKKLVIENDVGNVFDVYFLRSRHGFAEKLVLFSLIRFVCHDSRCSENN